MGNNQAKEPQQILIPVGELNMKSKYVAGQLEHQVEKLVNKIMREEKNLLTKYSEERRSIEDLLFKDELQIGLVEIHRIKAVKQVVLYLRFVDAAAQQIADCKGQFEILPPASQTALLNVAFSGDFLKMPDLKNYSVRIRQYFQLSPTFTTMMNNWQGVEETLKGHCQIIKMQRVAPTSLAQYYVEYMKRHALEPDPKVVSKMNNGEYSKDIAAGYGSTNPNHQFLSPSDNEKVKMQQMQTQMNQNAAQQGMPQGGAGYGFIDPKTGNMGNQNAMGGFNQGQPPQGQFNNNQFQQRPPQNQYSHQQQNPGFNNNQFRGGNQNQQGFNQNQGFNNPQQQRPNNNNNNQFMQNQGFGTGNQPPRQNPTPPPVQGNFGQGQGFNNTQQQPLNPPHQNMNQGFQQQQPNYQAQKPQNHFTAPPQHQQPTQPNPNNQVNQSNPFAPKTMGHDDIFGQKAANPNPGFGGPAGQNPNSTGDPQFDDFVNQLDDLRNL